MLSEKFWDDLWKTHETGWDIGYASPAMCWIIDKIENKEAAILIPGCGNAYEADYLVSNGFKNITLIDISETAVQAVKEKFKDNAAVKVLHQDFFKHDGKYDYILEQTFFCALDPELRPDYVAQMHNLLHADGILEGLLFGVDFEKAGPPFGGTLEEYKLLFSEKFEIIEISLTNESIKPRLGTELAFRFRKK
jgi:SAM-dependent methyltransferase